MLQAHLSQTEKARLFLTRYEYQLTCLPLGARVLKAVTRNPFELDGTAAAERPLVFIHVPKTAGSSIASALSRQTVHVPLCRFHAWDKSSYETALKVAFVRNPWTRLRSAFEYLNQAKSWRRPRDGAWAREYLAPYPDFASFLGALNNSGLRKTLLSYIHFRPQMDWIRHPHDPLCHGLDMLLRFEAIQPDTQRLFSALGKPCPEALPHSNRGKRVATEYPSSESIDAVVDFYREDFSVLGYDPAPPSDN